MERGCGSRAEQTKVLTADMGTPNSDQQQRKEKEREREKAEEED